MSWMNQIGGLVSKYASGAASGSEEQDYEQTAQHAPKDALAQGIASALRSDRTPSLGSAFAQIFQNASGDQKAGILNTILSAVGPVLIQEVLKNLNLGDLAGMFQGGSVAPQQAEKVPPHAVEQITQKAQSQDPNLEDKLGSFLAGNPGLVKSLGTGALGAVMSHLGK